MTTTVTQSSFLDTMRSSWTMAIGILGIAFSAGSIYKVVNETETRTIGQGASITIMKDNQTRMLESVARMEKYSRENDQKMLDGLEKMGVRIGQMEERVIRNEFEISRMSRDFYKD